MTTISFQQSLVVKTTGTALSIQLYRMRRKVRIANKAGREKEAGEATCVQNKTEEQSSEKEHSRIKHTRNSI